MFTYLRNHDILIHIKAINQLYDLYANKNIHNLKIYMKWSIIIVNYRIKISAEVTRILLSSIADIQENLTQEKSCAWRHLR